MGDVYTTRCPAFSDFAMAYSATAVLPVKMGKKVRIQDYKQQNPCIAKTHAPADVCAATNTDSSLSI